MYWSPIWTQAIYYGLTMFLSVFIISFMQKGFFWKFMRVKLSMGKLILVEIREIPNYNYRIGFTEGGFLKFRDKREGRGFLNRIPLPNKSKVDIKEIELPKNMNVFYKSMGCWRIDVDPETNCILQPDLKGVQSYDPLKFDELMTAAIEAKEVSKEKLILVGLVVIAIGVGVALFFMFKQSETIGQVINTCSQCSQCKAIVPSPTAATI